MTKSIINRFFDLRNLLTSGRAAGALLALAASLAPGASASGQELPPPPAEVLEMMDGPSPQPTVQPNSGPPSAMEYLGEYEVPGVNFASQSHEMLASDCGPALTESSGTWLRRGWWYANVDVVMMVRQWNHDTVTFMQQNNGTVITDTIGPALTLGRSSPGREASARFTLGRFLFRDQENRDHTMEMVLFGGGEFGHNCAVESEQPNLLNTPFRIDNNFIESFDNASRANIQYDSRFNSFEMNYLVTSRMKRDRMELQPNGEWVRRANSGFTYHGLAGLRYFDLTENIDWVANDIVNANAGLANAGGQYLVRTSNDLFGLQVGGGMTYETDRWNITGYAKGGAMAGDAKSRSSVVYTDAGGNVVDGVGFSKGDRESTMPAIVQAGLLGRWHLRPNVSFRAGYELLYITSVALAPHQIDFRPVDGKVTATGDSFYHGLTFGMEGYW